MADKRPRIPDEIADRIDTLRGDLPFEHYVHAVLTRHADFYLGDDTTPLRTAVTGRPLHSHRGGGFEIGTPPDGADESVLAVLYMHDEEMDNPVTADLDEAEIRALRDLCTDLLGGYLK